MPDLGLVFFPADLFSLDSSAFGLNPDGGGFETDLDFAIFRALYLGPAGEGFLELNSLTSPPT
jgi:hypothetical protein